MHNRAFAFVGLLIMTWLVPATAHGDEPEPTEPAATPAPTAPTAHAAVTAPRADSERSGEGRDVRNEVPNYAFTYTAYGATAKTLGAQAYGLGVAASGQRGILGGGLTVWGSPLDRLTLIGDAQRDAFGNFAPSGAALFRILGVPGEGWSFGALGKYKASGFGGARPGGKGTPPANPDEIESEIEAGMLLSYGRVGGLHLDLNAVTGFGTGDDGEVDTEGRVRVGYDVTSLARVGVDGQARVRLSGPQYLPNGRIWDFAGGPQVIFGSKRLFGSLTAGPATMGVITSSIGWTAVASVGGATF
jgi:hypothetical protein